MNRNFFLIFFILVVFIADYAQGLNNKSINSNFIGAENVDLSSEQIGEQGNWVKKREWLKSILETNEEIHNFINQIQDVRKNFYKNFKQSDKVVDDFYKSGSFEEGKVGDLFKDIQTFLEKKKRKELERIKLEDEEGYSSDLEIKVDRLEDQIKELNIKLGQFKLDVESLQDLDKSLIVRLEKLDEQIEIAFDEALKSEKICDQAWFIIDDEKVRSKYYELKAILEKVKNIKEYISVVLFNDFNQVIEKIKSQIINVNNLIKELEKEGLIVNDRAKTVLHPVAVSCCFPSLCLKIWLFEDWLIFGHALILAPLSNLEFYCFDL